MTGATPTYGWPYPDNADTLKDAVKLIPQNLATAIENTLVAFGGIAAPGAWNALPGLILATVGTFRTVQYSKYGSWVELRGVGSHAAGFAAGTTIGTLPAGFRPAAAEIFGVYTNAGSSVLKRLDVETTGAVKLQEALAAGGFITFSEVKFRIT